MYWTTFLLRQLRIIALLTCGAAAPGLSAQTPHRTLEPDWAWRLQPGVEWAELAGRGDTATLVVATRDARLQLIDLAAGNARLAEPLAVGRGVRVAHSDVAAGASPVLGHQQRWLASTPSHVDSPTTAGAGATDVTYCFDRHAAYAIGLSDPVGLKWQYGERPAAGEEFGGDPEVLTGWILGEVNAAGLLLINTDGRVVLLSATDGRVRWEIDLESRLPVARLHALGNTAVVLWKTSGQVKAAFMNLTDDPPTATKRSLASVWPIWSTLLSDGLLMVLPTVAAGAHAGRSTVVLCPKEGPPRRLNVEVPGLHAIAVKLDRESPLGPHVGAEKGFSAQRTFGLRAAAVDVYVPPACGATVAPAGRTDGSPSRARAALLLVGEGPQPGAYDLSTGKRRWPKDNTVAAGAPASRTTAPAGRTTLDIYALAVHGDRCLAMNQRGAVVHDAATGKMLGCCRRALPAELVASGLVGRFLYALYREPGGAEALLQLVRVELPAHAERKPDHQRSCSTTRYLKATGEIRQVLWSGRRLVLVEPNRLRAYTLP